MNLFCPTCDAGFAGTTTCPRCGGRLITPSEAFVIGAERSAPPPPPGRSSLGNRLTVGGVVSAGLFVGLREWAVAAVSLTGPIDGEWWGQSGGLTVAAVLRAAAVMVGGLLAGAGRPNGATSGGLVGMLLAAGFLVADEEIGPGVGVLAVGLAAALIPAAALTGAFGGYLYPPPADLPDAPPSPSRGSSLLHLVRQHGEKPIGYPTSWLRVLIGASLATTAVMVAEPIREGLQSVSRGGLNVGNAATGAFVAAQFGVFLMALAAGVGGATTGAGLRHGLLAGGLTAAAVLLSAARQAGAPPVAVEGYLKVLELPTSVFVFNSAVAVVVGVVVLCGVGGWLGGSLFPPLGQERRKLLDQS